MIHVDAHSHFGTYDSPNDEKQAVLTLGLSAMMALVTVVLIVAAVLSPAA